MQLESIRAHLIWYHLWQWSQSIMIMLHIPFWHLWHKISPELFIIAVSTNSGIRPENRADSESRFWIMTVSHSKGSISEDDRRIWKFFNKLLSSSALKRWSDPFLMKLSETKLRRISALRFWSRKGLVSFGGRGEVLGLISEDKSMADEVEEEEIEFMNPEL